MLLEFILPGSLILPGLWALQLARVRVRNNFERLLFSYILSLAIMFSLLYLGAIINAFDFASLAILTLTLASFAHLFASLVMKLRLSNHRVSLLPHIPKEELTIIVSIIGLLSVYTAYLSSRALLDSDVAQFCLPMSREIVRENGFTYSSGYDYIVFLKPIGVSVLYAWTYVVSGSTLSESFRLMPLVPILMLILLNYAITFSTTKSKTVGIISTAIFLVLPFNDRFLLYNAFYPDIFYYPLILASMYILLEYVQSKRTNLLFWAGIGLGVAGLLKAQTIYILIAFALVFLVLELKGSKKLSTVLCCFAPLCILIPSILASSIQNEGFRLSIPGFNETQLALLSSLSALSGICFYVTTYGKTSGAEIDCLTIKSIAKKMVLLLVPFAAMSSLWYINNFFRFGTLIWTSSLNLPNYGWALEVLKPLGTAQQTADAWHYFANFVFMFVDPAVMGYILFIPFLVGLFFVLRRKMEDFNPLLLFSIIAAVIIFSAVVISIPSTLGYNPRDIFVLAPLMTTLSAIGIASITSGFDKASDNGKKGFIPLLLVAYFGLLNYVHSVLVWFVSGYRVTMIGDFASSLGWMVGLNLTQTSLQLSYSDRVFFVGENISKIALLSLIAGIPVFALMISRHYKFLTKTALRLHHCLHSKRLWAFIKGILAVSLMLSILILPRAEILFAQGGIEGIREDQLKRSYGAFYELIADGEYGFDGGILTFRSPNGLPYYMNGVKIIDLIYSANLAFLKDCLLSGSSYKTVVKLRQQGIHYLLVNPSITRELDASLNFTISKMMQNPDFAILSKSLGSWKLYTLGPYIVEKTFIPLSSWSVDPTYTNASYNLNSTESAISLELEATDINSKVTIRHLDVPKLNLSDYDDIVVNVKGSGNARISMRFFLDDKSSLDVAYLNEPYTLISAPFDLSPYAERALSGDVYIGLKSSDGTPSSIYILQIFFAKVKG